MAILDAELEFSDGQSIASHSSGSGSQSDDLLDFTGGNAAKDGWDDSIGDNIGEGGKLYWTVQVGGSSDMSCSGSSAVMLAQLFCHTSTSVQSGDKLATIEIPNGASNGWRRTISVPTYTSMDRYMGIYYVASGGKVNSVTLDSWLSLDHDTQLA